MHRSTTAGSAGPTLARRPWLRAGVAVLLIAVTTSCREAIGPYEVSDPVDETPAGPRRLTTNPGLDVHPRWSAGGDSIHYSTGVFGGYDAFSRTLLSIPVEGGTARYLDPALQFLWRGTASPPLGVPVLSPDGSRLAYLQLLCAGTQARIPCDDASTLMEAIVRHRPVGATNGPLDDPGFRFPTADGLRRLPMRPSWSPDGRYLAVTDMMQLLIWDVETGVLEPLPTGPAAFPAWSPAGDEIAFVQGTGGAAAIRIIHLPTGMITTLTSGTDPAWSPDGSTIYFTRPTLGGGGLLVAQQLYSIPRVGGTERQLSNVTFVYTPAVSPDGRWIAFAGGGRDQNESDIWIMRLEE